MTRTALFSKVPRVAILALAAGCVLSANVASARYFKDGSVQNGTTGEWNLPTDFVCIKGVDIAGNITLAAGVTSRRDCNYYNTGLTGMNPVDVTASSMCGAAGTLPCNVQANCCGRARPLQVPQAKRNTLGTLTWVATA